MATIESRKKIIQSCKDYLLIIGSWLAGIGTIVLAIIEIIKYAHKT